MKKIIYASLIFFIPVLANCQDQNNLKKKYKTKIGLKAGYNWSYATADQSGINLNSRNGYLFGAFIAPASRGGFGFRSEIVFSRQGYKYDEAGTTTDVLNDYLYLPQ